MTHTYTDERIKEIAEMAELAFWEKVGELTPDITSGDCNPGIAFKFSQACEEAARHVILGNLPAKEG